MTICPRLDSSDGQLTTFTTEIDSNDTRNYLGLSASIPGNLALFPSSSSILSKRLYFAVLSPLEGAPVLIWPALVATQMSLMEVSSVSPDLCDTTHLYLDLAAKDIVSKVSVRVPIWFTLIRTAFATPSLTPSASIFLFVTNRSSPTSWTFFPSLAVMPFHPT